MGPVPKQVHSVQFPKVLARKLGPLLTSELESLASVVAALEPLEPDARCRVILLSIQKCGLTERFTDNQLLQLLRAGERADAAATARSSKGKGA